MRIHNYDGVTNEYVGSGDANPSPLEEGVFLIPQFATNVAPPLSTPDTHVAVFSEVTNSWANALDRRGQTYWLPDYTEHTVVLIGEDLPAEALSVKPVRPPSAKEVRDTALSALTYDFGDGRTIQTRPQDEQNIRNAIEILAADNIGTLAWVMEDNIKHAVTASELQTALTAGQMAGLAIWAAYTPSA